MAVVRGRKKEVLFIFLLIVFPFVPLFAQQAASEVYWYENGKKVIWHLQEDVYAYRTFQGESLLPSSEYSAWMHHYIRDSFPDKINIIYFNPESHQIDRNEVKLNVSANAQFQTTFPVITSVPDSNAQAGKWLLTDDMIMVQFRDKNISTQVLNNFRTKYALQWKNPEIAQLLSTNPIYIFAMTYTLPNVSHSIALAQTIYENDSALVHHVLPNRIVAYRPMPLENDVITFTRNYFNPNKQPFYIHLTMGNVLKVFYANEENTYQKKWFRIYDAVGQLILDRSIDNYTQQELFLRLEHLTSGTYFTFIENEAGKILHHQKFIKNL